MPSTGARLGDVGEKRLLERIVGELLAPHWRCPSLGPGDDAACASPTAPRLLVKIDGGSVAGSLAPWMSPADLGWQWVAAAASDLAAKAARPLAFVVSLGAPPEWGVEDLLGLLRGAGEAAEAHGAWLAGGDTNSAPGGGGWVDVAAVGLAAPSWGPVGLAPRPGDLVYATTGRHGLGWLALEALRRPGLLEDASVRRALVEWSRPLARLGFATAASWLPRGCVTAATDTSDGLGDALARLSRAAGVGVELEALPPLHPVAEAVAVDPALAALMGGQEYEVVFTVSPGCQEAVEGALEAAGLEASRLGVLGDGLPAGWARLGGRRLRLAGWDQFLGAPQEGG